MLGLLRGYGKCAVAVNGREAIQAIVGGIDRREAYDVVCLDIMMPEVDGVGVLRALRDAEACAKIGGSDRAKVLMTTALGDFDHQFSACAAACDAYLTKPISKLVLQRQLARLGYAPPE
jgi:two-component system chemotaxis response regulator CheY